METRNLGHTGLSGDTRARLCMQASNQGVHAYFATIVFILRGLRSENPFHCSVVSKRTTCLRGGPAAAVGGVPHLRRNSFVGTIRARRVIRCCSSSSHPGPFEEPDVLSVLQVCACPCFSEAGLRMHILEAGALCSIGARAYAGKGRSERCFTAYRAPAHCIQRAGRPHIGASGSKQPRHSWSQAFAVRFPALYGLQGTKRAAGKRKAAGSVIFATALPLEAGEPSPLESLPTLLEKTGAFYRFSRPHTVIGTAIGVISVSLLAIQSISDFSPRFYVGLLQSLVPALCMNIYIVGMNQIYDIEIDKVNKPTLPLASGEYSVATAVKLVAGFAAASMGMGLAVGSKPLLAALTVSLVLGTAYSMDLPLLRWKRSAVAAATCILAVRAVVVQIAFYLHMQSFVFGRPGILTKPVLFATGFMCFFSVVIALAKDIPDVEGDKIFGIRSFSVRLGQKKVFWLCVWLLEAAYAVAIMVGASSHVLWSKLAMIAGHAALAAVLFFRSKSVDLKSKAAITSFYMFIWKLFYTEYALIPFLR